jgi:ubiquinone/menaquinone biosynthesis C-methylase UbiE
VLFRSGIEHPRVIEVGCGSGYYGELLEVLAGPLDYTGVDYSDTMIAAARSYYPRTSFLVGDGSRLPFTDGCCDVVFSGNSLMHIPAYEAAVAEAARIARKWCVYHSVPVMENRPTTRMHKRAYGADVFEVVFNRAEIESLFRANRLTIESARETIPYDLVQVLNERTTLMTYACSKTR